MGREGRRGEEEGREGKGGGNSGGDGWGRGGAGSAPNLKLAPLPELFFWRRRCRYDTPKGRNFMIFSYAHTCALRKITRSRFLKLCPMSGPLQSCRHKRSHASQLSRFYTSAYSIYLFYNLSRNLWNAVFYLWCK